MVAIMKRIILLGLLALALIAVSVYRLYNKPHRQLENEKSISVDASTLLKAFEQDESAANAIYLDKVLEVSGSVSSISTNQDGKQVIVLGSHDPMFGISCTMAVESPASKQGDYLIIKGFCKGYLSDVVLTECKVVK